MFRKTKVCSGLMLAFGGSLVLGALPAQAQQQLERVEITGSSIKRVESEGALPVQIISRTDIERSGVTNTEQLLQSISALSSMGATNNATGAGSSTYGLSSISLRGLGDDRTLVLVNGRRVAAFAGGNGSAANVNAIPLAAIERVEILKDGASGVYGSDAVAGVVNFILTKDFHGFELAGSTGAPTRSGGGKSNKASITAGFGDLETNRFNVTASLGVERETSLFAKDRDFAKTGNVPPYLLASATGQGNIQGAFNRGHYDNSTTPPTWVPGTTVAGFGNTTYGNPLAATDSCATVNMFRNPNLTSTGNPYCVFDSNAFVGLTPKRELTNLSLNGAFKISDSMQLFGDALYSKSVVTQIFQPSPLRRDFVQTDSAFGDQGVDQALLIGPANPHYALAKSYLISRGYSSLFAGGDPDLAVTSRVFDFGPRTSEDTSTQHRLVAGLRGTAAQQDYEVALSTNESKLEGTVPDGFFSQVAFVKTINNPAADYDPWSLNQSAAFKAALAANGAKYTGGTLSAKFKSTIADGKLSGELAQLPAGPLLYAAGFQFRREAYVTSPSPALESGDIAGLGGGVPPVDRDRTVTAVFAESIIPVVKSLEASVALRRDRYNDAGSSSNYKATLRWQPIKEVMLRGSVGTGFRAPTLIDLWQPQTLGSSEQFNDPVTGAQDIQANSLTGGNPNLKPERSKQNSIGLVISPSRDFTASIDLFNVRIKDIIASPSAQEVASRNAAGDPAYAGMVTRDPSTNEIISLIQTLNNTGDAKVRGLDIEAAYRQSFEAGRLDLNLAGTYMIMFDQTTPGGVVSHKVGTMIDSNGDPVLGADSGGVVLRWKHLLSATWTQGGWAFTYAQNYYQRYVDGLDLNGDYHEVPSQATYDANIAYTGIKNLKIGLGVKNLFDKDPPIYIPASNQFQAGYDISQYDPRGRFVYLSASLKF
ncbi:MAG: TonB-dependent receptor [Rhizobacter sp.]